LPLYSWRCETCAEHWDEYAPEPVPSAEGCPYCLSQDVKRVWTLPASKVSRGIDDMTPDEIEAALLNKQWIEERAEDWASGKLVVDERGPRELRPVMPERLRKVQVGPNPN
jgi:hypothetical protein